MKSGLMFFFKYQKKKQMKYFYLQLFCKPVFLLYYATFPHRHCEGIYS